LKAEGGTCRFAKSVMGVGRWPDGHGTWSGGHTHGRAAIRLNTLVHPSVENHSPSRLVVTSVVARVKWAESVAGRPCVISGLVAC